MTKRDHTTAPPVWQATIPAVSGAPTPTPHAETETPTARLERLRCEYSDASAALLANREGSRVMELTQEYLLSSDYYKNALAEAHRLGQLIALDVPANGEVARIWLNWVNNGPVGMTRCDPDETEYIAQSALPSALRAERVAGMREAAGIMERPIFYPQDRTGYETPAMVRASIEDAASGARASYCSEYNSNSERDAMAFSIIQLQSTVDGAKQRHKDHVAAIRAAADKLEQGNAS